MYKVVSLCFRNHAIKDIIPKDFDVLSKRLMPDNILAIRPLVIEQNGVFLGVLNPNPTLLIKNGSICAGHFIDPSSDWWMPLSPLPDGAYALFRSDENTIELATDIVGSRTIWYAQTEDMFIASTSQRAIIYFLQSFEINGSALTWWLSAGNLGPGHSWDKRINMLNPDARLRLDRQTWKVTCEETRPKFKYTKRTEKEYERELREAIEYSFGGLCLDYSKFVLMLSGGLDSRATLLNLKDRHKLRCITWGLLSTPTNKKTDAYIARQLSEHFRLEQQYFALDTSNEPIEKILDRFVSNGEARTDNISRWLDGFEMWKSLFESNIACVIRGDEGFGWYRVSSDDQARRSVGGMQFIDYSNTDVVGNLVLRQFGEQIWPDHLKREHGESHATWRDRLSQEYHIPIFLAPLTDLKSCYIEVINPLISRRIINVTRILPDSHRTERVLFRKVVLSSSPNIPLATDVRTPNLDMPSIWNILKGTEGTSLIFETLGSSYFRELFSNELIDHVLKQLNLEMNTFRGSSPVRNVMKRWLPKFAQVLLTGSVTKP